MPLAARAPQTQLAEINITPLVDVMLVLLVIFMIAAPVLAHQVPIDLPQPGPHPAPAPTITLTVLADGEYRYDGMPLPADALAPQLALDARRHPQPELVIDAARSVPYQSIASTLAAARNARIERIGFKQLQ